MELDPNGIWTNIISDKISYPPEGSEKKMLIEDVSFWYKHRNNIIYEAIKRFPFKNNFVDIGGGNGMQIAFLSKKIPTSKFFLIEPSYTGCLNARKQRRLENVFNIQFQDFDFIGNNIGSVGLFDTLEHIKDDYCFLKELKEKLPPESIIYLTVPSHNFLRSDVDDYGGHYRRYNINQLRNLAYRLNLDIVYYSYFFSYLLPITAILRSLPYRIRGKRSNEKLLEEEVKNHNPSPTILKFFNAINRIELKAFHNARFRFGASCLVVFKN